MTHGWLAVLAVFGTVAPTGATTVHASCAVSPLVSVADVINASKVVFVGSVLYTTDENRSARVKVESIWKGPKLPTYVDVHGAAPGSGPFSASEGDRHYQSGQRYLFVPRNGSPPFDDYGECDFGAQLYTAELAAYAPPDVTAPDAPGPFDVMENIAGQYSGPARIAVLLFIAVVSIVLVNRRRRAKTVDIAP
jgi:hypothetical protein